MVEPEHGDGQEQYIGLPPVQLTNKLREIINALPAGMFSGATRQEFHQKVELVGLETEEELGKEIELDNARRGRSVLSKILLARFNMLKTQFVGTESFVLYVQDMFEHILKLGVRKPVKEDTEEFLFCLADFGRAISPSIFVKGPIALEIERKGYREYMLQVLESREDDLLFVEQLFGSETVESGRQPFSTSEETNEDLEKDRLRIQKWREEFIEYWEEEP